MGVVTPRGGLYASNGGLGYMTIPGMHGQLTGILPTAGLPSTRGMNLVVPSSSSQHQEGRGRQARGRGEGGGGGGGYAPNPFQPLGYDPSFYPTHASDPSASSPAPSSSSAAALPSSSPSSSAAGSCATLFAGGGQSQPQGQGQGQGQSSPHLIATNSQVLAYNLSSLHQTHLNGIGIAAVVGAGGLGGSPSAGKMDAAFSPSLKGLAYQDSAVENGAGEGSTLAGAVDYSSEAAKAAASLNAAAAGLAAAAAEYPTFSVTHQWTS